jgi:ribose transport system substrate-binding protein
MESLDRGWSIRTLILAVIPTIIAFDSEFHWRAVNNHIRLRPRGIMRTIALLALPLLLVVSPAACKPSDDPGRQPLILPDEGQASPPEPAQTSKTVALVLVSIANPFFVAMEKGARRAEAELGIRLLVATAANDTSVEQQTASMRQVMQDKVDAIVVVPGRSAEMIPVVKEARDAGFVVINIDNRLDPEEARKAGLTGVPFIGVNNEQGAYLSAQYLAGKLTGPTQVAIVGGDPAAQASKDREKGALRAFAERRNLELVATEAAYWRIDEAYQAAARIFERHPKVGGIFCSNDVMALGVIRYLEETRREQVLVASYDDIEEARAAIRRGRLLATVNQRADEQGYMGVKYAMHALAGETLPAETFVEVELVTAETLRREEQ